MTRRRLSLTVVLLCACLSDPDLIACGDKFLVPSRGIRFELSMSARQRAMVLVFANPASALQETLTRLSAEPVLQKAGYRPTIVGSATDLSDAMRRGEWDVIVVDLADAPIVRSRAADADAPLVVAVAQKLAGKDSIENARSVAAVLKSPTRGQAFVDALDEAVAARRDAQARAAKQPRR